MRFRHFARTLTSLAVLSAVTLSGCGDTKRINEKLEETDKKVTKAMTTFDPKEPNRSPLTISSRPWFGQQAISINSGVTLPAKFTAADAITLTFDQPLTLRQTANLIQSVTGIRTIVNENAANPNAGAGASTDSKAANGFLPINGREVRGSKMIWQGALDDLLNQVADNFDAGWSYDGASITLNQEITKTFMLHALATVVSDTSKVESGSSSGGSGGSLPSVTTSGTTELKVWDEVKSVVDSMVSGRGRATYSPSTGTITVTGNPSAISRVEDYLRFQNEMRLRRISVSVKVLELTLAQSVRTEVSTTQLLENILSNNTDLSISSGTGTGLSAAFIKGAQTNNDDISTTLEASKDVDRVSIVHSGAVVTLSDQPAPLQVGRQISYLARRSSTSSTTDTAGTETLEPGTVDIGLIMNILPRVVEDDRVMLRLNVALTDTDQPFPTFPADPDATNSIQLPEVDTTGFQQNTVLRNGETLVLAGFERNENSTADDGVPGFGYLLGGSRERTTSRQVTVMLITANILPEDPISVYSDNK